MAFSPLAGNGAECGPSNPMAGLMKQFHQDRSLQQDRFVQDRAGESSRSAFRSRNQTRPMGGSQLTEEFFRDEALEKGPHNRFEFSELGKELENIHPGMTEAPEWATDFMREQPVIMNDRHQMEEFDNAFQQHFSHFQQSHNHTLAPKELEAFERAFDEAHHGAAVDWETEFANQEDSWAAEFSKQETENIVAGSEKEALAKTAGMLLESIDMESNPKFKSSNFLQFMRQLRDSEVSIEGSKVVPANGESSWASEFAGGETSGNWASEFNQGTSQGAKDGNMWSEEFAKGAERGWVEDFTSTSGPVNTVADPINVPDDWATEFTNDPVNAAQMEEAFAKGTEFQDWVQQYHANIAHLKTAQDAEWEGMQKDWEKYKPDQGLGYRASNPEFDEYGFHPTNPYLSRAMPIDVNHAHNLSDSILALEAKLQLNPSDASSWQQLGFRQQENERDGAAIAALRKAVSMDPTLLDAWLALAVSYTNENCRADAYDCLEAWLQNNEKYKHISRSHGLKGKMVGADRHAFVTDLFLEAARSSPGEEMDADVQVGLGVLFNVSEEYQKAVDCFKAALASRPQDYLLWNKLGATLANSHETSAAIDAYFNALEINPSYIRARYNLAISCINLGQHKEAAEHLLTALALQQSSESTATDTPLIDENGNQYTVPGGMSDNVWDSLRMVMFMMNRQDLAAHCDGRNLEAFRGIYDF
ncbi:hypothetical protein K450DRAFT_218657 [Umbelopsis ramanniana AG]|uniref:Peroxin-5 n=1 Tax=Umbelopsis ramanniana AG TaxID=1314678 RepID=A0AAD5HH32_UMBRA|nr:uncharacterized protein K450DRAFT_218657 [Umbelopsis ramanniana AG]KAI8584207.1 hypothetical protein K450DRAFT_218657 [Umbelopsis ramanniana AG]